MNKTFWLQSEETQLGQWQRQIQEITGSPSFCVLPWIHLATRPNGDMRVCCVANASGADDGNYQVGLVKKEDGSPANFAEDLPSEGFNSEFLKSIRKTMLEGNISSSCKKCFDEETSGVSSKRIWETGTWYKNGVDLPKLISSTSADGSVPFQLNYLDLRLGNTCNLKCVMCSPHDSSKWVSDHNKIYPIVQSPLIKQQLAWDKKSYKNSWHESPKFWKEIYDQIPHLKQIYFAGGEPLMIKEHRFFLEEIVCRGFSKDIELRYNSNGLLLDHNVLELWKNFKKVKFGISIDGIEDRLNYIRYPTKWNTVVKNLQILDNSPENIEVTIACAVQILNIKHIPDFIKWKINQKFKKINFNKNIIGEIHSGGVLSAHLVWIPTWLSIKVLPKKDKDEVMQSFEELKVWLWNNYTQDKKFWEDTAYGWKRWTGLLEWMNSDDHSNLLPDFSEYIKKLDFVRKTDFKNIFPELAHLL